MNFISESKLIVALDCKNVAEARNLVIKLGNSVEFYKVGLSLLDRNGLEFAFELRHALGKRVFLDLKLFDIANTIRMAVQRLVKLQPEFLTVHGDPHVVRASIDGRGAANTKILAVTILTSLDRRDLDNSLVIPGNVNDIVAKRATYAFAAGADGIVCSPREITTVRKLPESHGKLIISPGVRLNASVGDDQKRTLKPSEAIIAGANYIVVGRPITQAKNPRKTIADFETEIQKYTSK